MSATRPAIEFSIGIMASAASPSLTAAKASSKVGQGSGCQSGIGLLAGDVGVRAGLALEGDDVLRSWLVLRREDRARARSRSSGVSTPSGTSSTTTDVDAHAGLERAQLLQPLALLERRRRQRDEARERRRR